MLPGKIIGVISIDHSRQMMSVDRNIGSRGNLVQVFCLNVTIFENAEEESKNEKRWEEGAYLDSKGGHEASIVELIIVQLLPNLIGINHAMPPQGILSIGHGERGKHELQRIHKHLWGILTHQLAAHPLCQVKHPQTGTLRLGNPRSNNDGCLRVGSYSGKNVGLWVPVDL